MGSSLLRFWGLLTTGIGISEASAFSGSSGLEFMIVDKGDGPMSLYAWSRLSYSAFSCTQPAFALANSSFSGCVLRVGHLESGSGFSFSFSVL